MGGKRKVIGLVAATALVMACAAPRAFALPGFYLGVGPAGQSAGGDLDGTRSFSDPSGTQTIYAGKLNDGTGLAGLVGFGINRFIGLEAFGASTNHTATHQALPNSTPASLITLGFGLRLTLPTGKSSEVFARIEEAVAAVGYQDYAIKNSTGMPGTVAFGGGGEAFGLGVLFYGKLFGLEIGAMTMQAKFDSASTTAYSSGSLPAMTVPITTTYLALVLHQ